MATIRGAFIYRIFKAEEHEKPKEEKKQDERIVNVPLNIGTRVLDIWDDGCYILVCTNSGVECLNSRTLESVWYFDSFIVKTICSNQETVCFGTISSGVYYDDFPSLIGELDNFLADCKKATELTSSCINDICCTDDGFFLGGDSGVDVLINYGADELKTDCQLTCSGVNSVAYSFDTETYYWSTVDKAYCADTCE